MNQQLLDTRTYKFEDETGKISFGKFQYRIKMVKGKVETVWNEYNHSIMPNSDTFEYFKNKYEN